MNKGILFFLILTLISCTRHVYNNEKYFDCDQNIDFLKDTDKKYLIFEVLKHAAVEKNDTMDSRLIRDQNKIYILNTYYDHNTNSRIEFSPMEIPYQIGQVQFCMKSEKELQIIAKKTNDFRFLCLGGMNIDGDTAIISTYWQGTTKPYGLSGEGYTLRFKKIKGEWIYDTTISYISA